jgi:hypothetical protein
MKSVFLGKAYLMRSIGALIVLICCFGGCKTSKRGNVIETWETTNGYFKIRVVAYEERALLGGLPGALYVYSSSLAKEDSWTEVMVFRHDDKPPIPRDNLGFVSDQTGYIFMNWRYDVTTDAGKTWSVWDAAKNIPDWDGGYKYGGIRHVTLSPDGNGLMVMRPNDDPRRKDIVDNRFRTNDFGRHWDKIR